MIHILAQPTNPSEYKHYFLTCATTKTYAEELQPHAVDPTEDNQEAIRHYRQ
jgi:hypothetical protein